MMGIELANQDRRALESQARDWLVRLTSGQATAEDAQAFKAWCRQSAAHAEAMSDVTRVWDLSRPAGHALARRLQAGAERGEAVAMTDRGRHPGRRALLGGALAAGVVAYVVVRPPAQLWPALSDMTADYRTGTGEQRRVVLANSVVVEMNTQTSLNFRQADAVGGDPVGGGSTVLELLTGEAQVLLQSAPSAPLTVMAGGGRLLVSSATQFNVRATGSEVCVTCMTGAVELAYGENSVVAKAHQQVSYGKSGIAMRPVPDLASVSTWRDRVLVFDNTPLAVAVEEINRYRPGRLIVTSAELGRRKVQAQLRLDQLAGVVDLIRISHGVKVTTLPAGIVLLG